MLSIIYHWLAALSSWFATWCWHIQPKWKLQSGILYPELLCVLHVLILIYPQFGPQGLQGTVAGPQPLGSTLELGVTSSSWQVAFQPAQFSQNLSLSLWARARNWEGPSRHLAGSWFPTVRRNRTQAILQREGFYRPSTPASREAIPSHISGVCKCDWINISSPSLSPNFWRPSLHPHPLWIWRVTLPRNQKTKVANRMVTRKNAAGLNNERLEGILQSNMIVCFCLP